MSTALNDLLHNAEKAQKLREILKNQARTLSLDDVREIQDKLQLALAEGRKALETPEEVPDPEQAQAREALEQIDRAHADAQKVFERKYRWQTEVEGNAQIITEHAGRAANLHKLLREKRRELSARDVEGMHDELNRLESEALAAWGVARGFNLPVSLEHRLFRATEAITNALKDAFGTLDRKKQWEDAVAMNVSAIEAELRRLEALVLHGAPAKEGAAEKRKDGRAGRERSEDGAATGARAQSEAGPQAQSGAEDSARPAAPHEAGSETAAEAHHEPDAASVSDQHLDDTLLDAALEGLTEDDHHQETEATLEADPDRSPAASLADDAGMGGSAADEEAAAVAPLAVAGADARSAVGEADAAPVAEAPEAGAAAASETQGAAAPEAGAAAANEAARARHAGPEIGRLAKKIEEMLRTRRPLDRAEQDRLSARLSGMLERARASMRPEAPAKEGQAPAARKFSREEMHRAKSDVENALAQAEAALGIEWPPPRRSGASAPASHDTQGDSAARTSHPEAGSESEAAQATHPEGASEAEAAQATHPEGASGAEAAQATHPEGASEAETAQAGHRDSAAEAETTQAGHPVGASEAEAPQAAGHRAAASEAAPHFEPMKLGAIKVVQGLLQRAREVLEAGAVPGGDRKGLWARFRNASDQLRSRRTETRSAELSHLQARAAEADRMARSGNPANARRSIQEIQRAVVESGLGKADRDALLKALRESWEASLGRQDTMRQERKRREEEGLHKLGEHFQRWEGRVENISALISRLEEQLIQLKERQRTSTSIGYRVVAEQRINETKGRIQELKGVLADLSGKIEDVKPRLEAAGWTTAQAEAMAEAIRANGEAIDADQTGAERGRTAANRREERGSRDVRGPLGGDNRGQSAGNPPRGDNRAPRPDNRSQASDNRGPRPDNRGQGGDNRGPRPDNRGQGGDNRGPGGENRGQGANRGPRPDNRSQGGENGVQGGDNRGPRPDNRGQGGEKRGQGGENRGPRPDNRGPRSEGQGASPSVSSAPASSAPASEAPATSPDSSASNE